MSRVILHCDADGFYAAVECVLNTIAFDTAWTGVTVLMKELSEQRPDVGLSYTYAGEEWGDHTGEFEFEKGETLYEHTPDDGSLAAISIADHIFGNGKDYAEEDEREDEFSEDGEDDLENY